MKSFVGKQKFSVLVFGAILVGSLFLITTQRAAALPSCFDSVNADDNTISGAFPRAGMAKNASAGCSNVPIGGPGVDSNGNFTNGGLHIYLSSYYYNDGNSHSALHTPSATLRLYSTSQPLVNQQITVTVHACRGGDTSVARVLKGGSVIGSGTTTVSFTPGEFEAYGNFWRTTNFVRVTIANPDSYNGLCKVTSSVTAGGSLVSFDDDDSRLSSTRNGYADRYNQVNWQTDKNVLGPPTGSGAFALRTDANSTDSVEYSMTFRPDCTITSATTVYLKVYDGDSPVAGQPAPNFGNPAGTTNNTSSAGDRYARTMIYRYRPNGTYEGATNLTGDSDYRVHSANDDFVQYAFTVQPGYKYSWVFWNISARNGIQVWIPFSEITGHSNFSCPNPDAAPTLTAVPRCQHTADRIRRVIFTTSDADVSGASTYTIQRRYRVRNAANTDWEAWSTWANVTHTAGASNNERYYAMSAGNDFSHLQFQFRTRGDLNTADYVYFPSTALNNNGTLNDNVGMDYGPCVRASCTFVTPPATIYVNEETTITVRVTNTGTNDGRSWAINEGYQLRRIDPEPVAIAGYLNTGAAVAVGGTRDFSVTIQPTTTGAGQTFTWRMSRGATQFGSECTLTRSVIYRPPVVTCVVTPPGILEAGTQGSATLLVRYNSPATPTNATAAPTGTVTARDLTNGVPQALPPPVSITPPANTAISRGITGVTYQVDNVDIGGPGQMTWGGSATVVTPNGIGGNHVPVTASCNAESLAANIPYVKDFGGEVWAGGNFNATCQPPSSSPGAIYAFSGQDGSSRRIGASAQFSVTALMRVNEFYSASNHEAAGLNSYPPKGLTFGNYSAASNPNATDRDNANSTFGGGYGNNNGKCITDFYGATQDASIRSTGTFPPVTGGVPSPVASALIGSASSTAQTVAVPAGTYQVDVSGTYLFRGAGVPGSIADAYCANDNTGTWNNGITANTTANILELLINGSAVSWQAVGPTIAGTAGCAANHTYRATISTPNPMSFSIFDNGYADNVGTLTVTISSVSVDTWPGAGRHQYAYSGDLDLNGLTVPAGRQIAVYVDGDVYIRNNIMLTEGSYASVEGIPFFAIIARGNIYIDRAVTRIDGLYIAQPGASSGGVIYTCARGTASAPVAFSASSTAANDIYAQCGTQLSVNGSLVAQRIKFLRTLNSLRNATFGEVPNFANGVGTNAAEVVNYTPQMWLAPSPLRDPNIPEDGNGSAAEPYDAIRALPPVF